MARGRKETAHTGSNKLDSSNIYMVANLNLGELCTLLVCIVRGRFMMFDHKGDMW